MAIDLKYGRVTTERGTLGDDEPVVVFRAQDLLLPDVLTDYRDMCRNAGSPQHHLTLIDATRVDVLDWQSAHHAKVPRSDALIGDES